MKKEAEYLPTDYPGIQVRIKEGKYVVTLDCGRQYRLDKKTGKQVLRRVKTRKVVATLKEAKALQGENNKGKRFRKSTGVTGKKTFTEALKDYNKEYADTWSESYRIRKEIDDKRFIACFADMDVRQIDTLEIERFFSWCRKEEPGFEALSNNTIQKLKTHLSQIWTFMKKRQSRYSITDNIVTEADVGEIEKYKATAIDAEQLNYIIQYALNNEKDYSIFILIGFAGLSGMRRGEIAALRWGKVDFEQKTITIDLQRAQYKSEDEEHLPTTIW